jgi:precorrin-4 methylase
MKASEAIILSKLYKKSLKTPVTERIAKCAMDGVNKVLWYISKDEIEKTLNYLKDNGYKVDILQKHGKCELVKISW